MADHELPSSSDSSETHGSQLEQLRTLLFKQEQARLAQLNDEVKALQSEIEALKADLSQDREAVVPTVTDHLGDITTDAVQNQRGEMARALGPIIGDATRVQIRESRDEMVEVLYPIIGDSVFRSVSEQIRNLTRRIRAQQEPSSRMGKIARDLVAPNSAEEELLKSLDFEVEHLLLIDRETGLPIAQHAVDESLEQDSDLMSSMLTAISDFANDSFHTEGESNLREIVHGDKLIFREYGSKAHLAVVTTGAPPPDLQDSLRRLLAELHLNFQDELDAYDGDPDQVQAIPPQLRSWTEAANAHEALDVEDGGLGVSSPVSLTWVKRGVSAIAIIGLLFCCVQAVLTGLLVNRVFFVPPSPTVVVTEIVRVTVVSTPTVLPTFTPTPTATPTSTPTSTLTSTPTHTPTATPTPTPTFTPTPVIEVYRTNVPVWAREIPSYDEPEFEAIPLDTEVEILAVQDEWIQIQWVNFEGANQLGWIEDKFVSLVESDTIDS